MRRIGFGLIMALGVVSAGCNKSDPVDPTVPARLVKVDGEPQNGLAGTPADAPLRVRVDNSAGDPVSAADLEGAAATGSRVGRLERAGAVVSGDHGDGEGLGGRGRAGDADIDVGPDATLVDGLRGREGWCAQEQRTA